MGRDHLPGAGMRQGIEWALVLLGERWGEADRKVTSAAQLHLGGGGGRGTDEPDSGSEG